MNLWVKDTLNNELWTLLTGDKRVAIEATMDIIGYCQANGQTVVVSAVKNEIMADPRFDKIMMQVDPY